MSSITINLPDNLDVSDFDVQMTLASKWYEQGKLSSGQAAKMVGLSKRSFLEMLAKYEVSVFGYDLADIEKDLLND